MVSAILSRLVILVFGTLYPAYASYKAVRTKNVKEYVKWMMYWIVFALFCAVETFSDFFLSWFPFYYEFKIIFVLWMLSPFTQGSSFLFKKFVHPQLARREKDIDEMIEQATKQGYTAFVDLGNKGIKVILNSVIMGQSRLADHLRRSYSTSDLAIENHEIIQRHEPIGDHEDKEDELDNRLIEDLEELAKRTTTSGTKTRSSSSGLSLSSVKEEDGEEHENITTETYTIPTNIRRHHSVREDNKTATRMQRCQSLPPNTDKYTKPFIIASTNLESKRQFFSKFQSVEKKEISCPPKVSSKLNSKRYPLTRSRSQDSATTNIANTISSFANRYSMKVGKNDVETISENKQKPSLLESDSVIRTDNQSSVLKDLSPPQNVEPGKNVLETVGKDFKKYTEEEIRILRNSVPRFPKECPFIDEAVPLELISRSLIVKDKPVASNKHSSQSKISKDSTLVKAHGDISSNQMLSPLPVDILGDDLSNLIFLNVEDDMDDQCPTPVAEDSPPRLSLDDEIKDTTTEKKSDGTGNLQDDNDSIYKDDDDDASSSVSDYKSLEQLDSDFDTFSDAGSSTNWETLSEASLSDLSECHSEDLQDSSTFKDVSGSWSAPGSPASFIRGSRYEEDTLQSWKSPTRLLMHQRKKDGDETSWRQSVVQGQTSLPSYTSRNVLYSWPSPTHFIDTVSTRAKEKITTKSYGHHFDPFKTWHPPTQSGFPSYLSQSIQSPSATYLPRQTYSTSERNRYAYDRSASKDMGGGEVLYSRYLKGAYSTNSLSPKTNARARTVLLSTKKYGSSISSPSVLRSSISSRYATNSYYTSKK